ncbi:hypothetical protein PoB_005361600 [Plakobranchus ocellatus]|uniref:Uncharacterized protein n=1 Tax=Plakobranchus ocellatus TaxID=259542 RepID=A0AAV4C2X1_9GAST|nr:hypothetical protein PoB_005361600 [Plakobranchus ocellatus]
MRRNVDRRAKSMGPILFPVSNSPNLTSLELGLPYGATIPHQGDLRLQGPPSGRGADCGARTRDRWIPADLRAESLATKPPTSPKLEKHNCHLETY